MANKDGSMLNVWVNEDISIRDSICALQARIEQDGGATGDDVDRVAPVIHHFAPNMYGREIFLAKDTIVIGKLHKHSHLNVLLTGHVKVVTEEGEEELIAPLIWTSKAGIKRAVYAYEDSTWMTIHPTDTDDLEEIETNTIAKQYSDIGLENPKALGIKE